MTQPLYTTNYDDLFTELQSNDFLRVLLTDWDVTFQTYETHGTTPDSSIFKLPPSVKFTDLKQTWFTYPIKHANWLDLIERIKQRACELNGIKFDSNSMGSSFLIMVPGAQTQEHIDRGKYSGTSLIFPIIGASEFNYNGGDKRYLIDRPSFAINTEWHNYINRTDCLSISFVLNLQIDISQLQESNLEPLNAIH